MNLIMSTVLSSVFLAHLAVAVAVCLEGYEADPSYPGPAKYTLKLWHENLFTAQVMRILLNDVLDQDVEFFSSYDTDLNEVVTNMAGTDPGFDSKDAAFWNVIAEATLASLRNTSEYISSEYTKFLILPLGSGAPRDYYKVIHPGLGIELPYIYHLLTLVSFAYDEIEESYFETYDTADEAFNASCEWLQENTDLVTLWTPWIELKDLEYILLYFTGITLIIICGISFFILWFLLTGSDDVRRSLKNLSPAKASEEDERPSVEVIEDPTDTTKKWIQAGDVKGLAFICMGCFISGFLVFFTRRTNDMQCNAFPFIMHGGVLFVIGSLTARTDKLRRIYKMAHGGSLRIKNTFWNTWFAWVILPSIIVFLFLLTCYLLIPLRSTWFLYDESFYRECVLSDEVFGGVNKGAITTEKFIVGAPIIFEGFLGLRLMRQLWNLEGLEDQYNERSQILSVLLVLGIIVTASVIVEIITMNPYTKDTFEIGMLLVWYYFVQAFMFLPRFWRAHKKREVGEGFIKDEFKKKMEVRAELTVARSTESKPSTTESRGSTPKESDFA